MVQTGFVASGMDSRGENNTQVRKVSKWQGRFGAWTLWLLPVPLLGALLRATDHAIGHSILSVCPHGGPGEPRVQGRGAGSLEGFGNRVEEGGGKMGSRG